jgi:glycosyltransferase involved in cell wall biosynthesis
MFFSVITITYNSSQFIRDAIESVLSSSYTNFEYIIGDDCSIDNTWEIINDFNDSRIVKYRNDTNLGEYPNRNKAVTIAKGDWILFIDGDDVIYPHGLWVLHSLLKDKTDISIAVMCPENELYIAPLELSSKEIYEIEFSEHGLINRALSHTVYHANTLRLNPFKVNDYIGLDTLNRLEVLMTGNCLLIQDNLTFWRRSNGQSSNMLRVLLKDEMFLMSNSIFSNIACPLSIEKQNRYIMNRKIRMMRKFVRFLFYGEYGNIYKLFMNNNLNFLDIRFLFYAVDNSNPMLNIEARYRYKIR